MNNTTFNNRFLSYFTISFLAFICSFSLLNAQAAIGPNPTISFWNNSPLLSTGSDVAKIRVFSLLDGQFRQGASIHAIASDSPVSDFLPMDLSFRTGTTALQERFRIMGNGNIGVNTSNPNARFEIKQYVTPENINTPLFEVSGGLASNQSSFNISNQPNNRLRAKLDGDLLLQGGRVLINTDSSGAFGQHKLLVNGSAIATEFWVKQYINWPDYVFTPSYQLMSLSEVKCFIETYGHLPNIPSAAQIAQEGFGMAALQAKSLEKIEELTLHLIDHEEKIENLEQLISTLMQKIERLEAQAKTK